MSQQQNQGQDPNSQITQQQGLPAYAPLGQAGYMPPINQQQMFQQQQYAYMQQMQMQQAAAYQQMMQAQPGTAQQVAPQAPYQQSTFPMAPMAPPMAMPMFQTQAPQNNFLQPQLDNLKQQVQTLNNDLDTKNNKIRDYEDQIDTLTRQQKRQKQELSDKDVELQEHKTKQIESDNKITALEADIRKAATQNRSLEYQLGVMTKEIENLRQEQEQNENDKQKQIDQMRQDFRKQLQLPIQQQTDPQVGILQVENKKLKAEIQVLKQQLQQYAAQMQGMSTSDQINELQSKIDQEHKYFMDAKDETMRLKKQSETKINELDSTIQTLKTQILKLNNDIKLFNMKLKDSNALSENLKSQLANEQQTNKELEAELRKPQLDRSHIQQIQQAQEKVRLQMQQQLKQQEILNAEKQEQLMKEQEEKLKKMLEQKQKDVLGRNKKNQELLGNQMGKAKQNLGTLDVCYIVDSTLSMEPYIKQTRDCIKQSSQLIKQLTNRDTNWSTICYYDIEQKPANGFYLQHDFTKNMQDIEKFLDEIKCKGGSDPPEDVKGAIEQMLTNLKWTARFKIALLITDAPCHGIKYHGAMRDNHPNSDIEETILKVMDQNILFIGLNFKQYTTQMYEEIKKIYQAKQKQDIYSFVEMNNVALEKIGAQMAKCIGDASINATGTNNNSTKSKKAQQARLQAKDGAMEALCSKGNFYNFEKQADVICVQTKFKVLKIEITQEAFEKNLTEIHNIGKLNTDYRVTEEGQWDCIRTDKPFAFGMMKDVFLMKKNGAPDELYVIKTPIGSEPYSTQKEAIAECRSHLLCQQLMNRFQKDIEEATQSKKILKKYPKVIYSSFLILKESETKYWIAERFFKGEFVKYNNNFGFMNDSQDELNKFAQAFSLYTLYISGARYIINDVQGVGIYFTDPAINTLEGDFDDTDMGEDGMGMFLVNYQSKRHLTKEIEDLLDIKFEDPNQN